MDRDASDTHGRELMRRLPRRDRVAVLCGLFGASLLANLVMGLAAYVWLGRQIRSSSRAEPGSRIA
jgi:hypothetical protein